jgi:hypothetical protein
MKRFLIKIAYKILQHYQIETMPFIYHEGDEYEVIAYEAHPENNKKKGWLVIKAVKK